MKNAVVVEELFDAPVERVWSALTDKDKMKKWYFDPDKFSLVVGFNFKFPGNGQKGEDYLHLCEITEIVPLRKLQYSWQYENLTGISIVTFELFPDGERTHLRLTHSGLESFPKNNANFSVDSFKGGWTMLIKESLRDFLIKN